MDPKLDALFGHYLAEDTKCCKLCKHSYFREESESGFCKLSVNTQNPLTPKIVDEMASCLKWEKKT
jgi:hypothetical protein